MTWIPNRRALVAGLGATLAALTTGARPLRAQSAPQGNTPARHDLDRWMDELPAKHRIFVDTASREGGQNGVMFAGNVFNVNESAYGVKAADVGLIICFRHQSTPYGYNEAMWTKYGQYFSQRLELPKPVTVNPLNSAGPTEEGARTVGHAGRQRRCHRRLCAGHSWNGRPNRHGYRGIAGSDSQRAHGESGAQRPLRPSGRRRRYARAGATATPCLAAPDSSDAPGG